MLGSPRPPAGVEKETRILSRQDRLDPSKIKEGHPKTRMTAIACKIDLRLGLDEVAAAEEENLREAPPQAPKQDINSLSTQAFRPTARTRPNVSR